MLSGKMRLQRGYLLRYRQKIAVRMALKHLKGQNAAAWTNSMGLIVYDGDILMCSLGNWQDKYCMITHEGLQVYS